MRRSQILCYIVLSLFIFAGLAEGQSEVSLSILDIHSKPGGNVEMVVSVVDENGIPIKGLSKANFKLNLGWAITLKPQLTQESRCGLNPDKERSLILKIVVIFSALPPDNASSAEIARRNTSSFLSSCGIIPSKSSTITLAAVIADIFCFIKAKPFFRSHWLTKWTEEFLFW